MNEQQTKQNDIEILEINKGSIQKTKDNKKKKVKDGKRGFFTITKYNFIAGIAYIVQVVMDKAGIFGKILGAGLGQIATNHYNAVCAWVTRYIIDNELFRTDWFLKVFGGSGTFYENELAEFNKFMANPNPTFTEIMNGGVATEGVIQQSLLMNVIGTVIQFVVQNPVLVAMPLAAFGYELIRKLVDKVRNRRVEKSKTK